MKDEGLIGKKMREKYWLREKPIGLENVRLYVQSMTKGDLEVNRVELKSNQSTMPATAMKTAPCGVKASRGGGEEDWRIQKLLKRKD